MSDTKGLLIAALSEQDADRPRSKQKMLGPSSLGSCQRKTVYHLMDVEPINVTSRLAAVMGTAIHDTIEKALRKLGHTTVEITVPGIAGLIADAHVDFYQPDAEKITDWKTTKKSNLSRMPYESQRWQVHTYGYLAKQAGLKVKEVELVIIPRDGDERDIKVHVEPYDEATALEALSWLRDRYAEAANGVLPAPEKYASFCRLYCPFYGEEDGYCLGK